MNWNRAFSQRIKKGIRKPFSSTRVDLHLNPSPAKSCLHLQVNEPSVFKHLAFLSQGLAKNIIVSNWLHRCWWRMLETECVGDNYKMSVLNLTIFLYSRRVPTFKKCHRDLVLVTNILESSSTLCHPHDCHQTLRIKDYLNIHWYRRKLFSFHS